MTLLAPEQQERLPNAFADEESRRFNTPRYFIILCNKEESLQVVLR